MFFYSFFKQNDLTKRLRLGAIGWSLPLMMAIVHPSATQAQIAAGQVTASPVETDSLVRRDSPLAPIQPEDAYRLGAGDQIRIDIFDVPELSAEQGTYVVLVDGSLNLPWIGRVSVRGLTLSESAQVLTQAYSTFIHDPLITVSLLTPRPLRVGIVGEVNRPGPYITGQAAGAGAAGDPTGNTAGQLGTVTQAIQTAGGITQLADIRNIEIRRPQNNGSEEIIAVDLWSFLQTGSLSQDITLRDGDTVAVPTATAINEAEASQLAAASFSPGTINVNVVGEVVKPGLVVVQPNISMNQAILAAGGFDNRRARRANVELVRLNPNGTVSKRTIPVDFAAGLNETTNPALRNNDIVIVRRSGLSTTADFLSTLVSPLTPLLAILGIFGI
jgi:polysaccharide biosynthesis/export protein